MSAAARDTREPDAPARGSSERISVVPGGRSDWVSDWNDDPPPYLPTETDEEIDRNTTGA
jgi:hypothetical protein